MGFKKKKQTVCCTVTLLTYRSSRLTQLHQNTSSTFAFAEKNPLKLQFDAVCMPNVWKKTKSTMV